MRGCGSSIGQWQPGLNAKQSLIRGSAVLSEPISREIDGFQSRDQDQSIPTDERFAPDLGSRGLALVLAGRKKILFWNLVGVFLLRYRS